MNKAEIIKLIRVLSANYRNWPEEGKEQDTVMLWESMLDDMDYDTGRAAVKAHMARSVFPPTIADIREVALDIQSDQISAMESWGMVTQAIRKHGYYNEKEALESLPPAVASMAQRFSWRELCLSEQPDVLRAQWRMAWESHVKYERDFGVLPSEVKNLIEGAATAIKRLE